MAFSYRQRECETCGGQLQYHQDTQLYECIYCGNTYEREQQYDGAFSVRYAAKQALVTLLDVTPAPDGSLTNWQLVQNNLNDAQKIDPSYAGTIVAQVAASITRVRFLASNPEAARTDAGQAQAAYARLGTPFDAQMHEEEADFYDQLDSPDATAMLISVFGAFHDDARVAYLQRGFSASDIHSTTAALDTLNRAFSMGDWQQIDELMDANAPLDATMLFTRLLSEYPDGERKVSNVAAAVARGANGKQADDALSHYLTAQPDAVQTKLLIAQNAINRGVVPNGNAIAALIDADPNATSLFAAFPAGRLDDQDIATIIKSLLTHASGRAIVQAVNALANSGHYVVFPQDAMLQMLARNDLNDVDRKALLQTAASTGMTERRRQALLAAYIANPAPAAQKIDTVHMLAEGLNGINPMNVEDYLLHSRVDGAAKPEVLKALLAHVTARETVRSSAVRYRSSSPDTPQVTAAIWNVLASAGLV